MSGVGTNRVASAPAGSAAGVQAPAGLAAVVASIAGRSSKWCGWLESNLVISNLLAKAETIVKLNLLYTAISVNHFYQNNDKIISKHPKYILSGTVIRL